MYDYFVAPGTAACQAPLSMGFSGHEYWSGLLCPFPADLPDPEVEPISHTRCQIPYRWATREASLKVRSCLYCLSKCLSWTLLNTGIKYTWFRRMMNKSSTRTWKLHRKVEIWDTWLNKGFLIRKTANSLTPRGHTGQMTWHKYWNSVTLKIRIKLPTLWMLVWWVLTNRNKVNLSTGSVGNFY